MSNLKMRASFSQRADEIRGTIELPSDGTFVLECVSMVIEQLAKQSGVDKKEVCQDLYALVCGKVI